MAKTNLENCKGLKCEAINKKRFQDAAKLSKEESEMEAHLTSLTKSIAEIEAAKLQDEVELENYSKTMQELLDKAAKQQSLFDKECYKALVSNLRATLTSLKSIPSDISTISRSLLEYDACYTYSFLNMVKRRSSSVVEGIEELGPEGVQSVELLLKNVREETKYFNSEIARLKTEIDEALKNNDFERAEKLSPMYDLIACLNHSVD